jgi:hypothetical protein
MNLIQVILKEHSKKQKDKIVSYVGKNPKRFAELVRVFLAGPYRVTQRAAYPLSYCIEQHPGLAKPHLKTLIKNILKPGQHTAVKRNTLRLLQFIAIPKSLQGLAADIGFKLLTDRTEPVAVKVFSMSVLKDIALEQPELKNELIPIIEEQLPYSTPAFTSRARKVLKELRK